MDILSDVRAAFGDKKLPDGDTYYSTVIPICRDIYGGAPPWKRVKKSGLYSRGEREMNGLNMAKILCDEMSALTFTEQTAITVSDERLQEFIDGVLTDNGFYKNLPAWLSRAYALGGGVLKIFYADEKISVDYLSADCFYPVEYNSRQITGGVFEASHIRGRDYYTLLERYGVDNGNAEIEHKLFRSSTRGTLGNEVPLSELYDAEIPDKFTYEGVNAPLFAYFKPAAANNLDILSCLGMPIFAGCFDTLKALDIAFDSFCREFILGRKRIIVPSNCIRTVVDPETGETKRYFDADDEVYQAMKCDEEKDLHIADNTMTLRIGEHVAGINALLNILCCQTGLSAGTFDFNSSGGMKTATEIISENSKTFRTAKSNKNMLSETLEQLVRSIISLGQYYELCPAVDDYDVTVAFNDNIIEDDNTIIDNNIKLVSSGLRSKLKAIMEINKCDEETAEKELEQINKEYAGIGGEGDNFDPTAGE